MLAIYGYDQFAFSGLVKTAGQKGVKLLTAEVLDIAHQGASGCGYINSLRLAHMDIAARNMLFGENNRIKLADFGLTRPVDQGTNSYRLKER